jgi:hypothetical protein
MKKGLLFWKKEAKNFCELGRAYPAQAEARTSGGFLLLFFKKEGLLAAP